MINGPELFLIGMWMWLEQMLLPTTYRLWVFMHLLMEWNTQATHCHFKMGWSYKARSSDGCGGSCDCTAETNLYTNLQLVKSSQALKDETQSCRGSCRNLLHWEFHPGEKTFKLTKTSMKIHHFFQDLRVVLLHFQWQLAPPCRSVQSCKARMSLKIFK